MEKENGSQNSTQNRATRNRSARERGVEKGNLNLCKICKKELSNSKHTHCMDCLEIVRDAQRKREQMIEDGLYDDELYIVDRTEWV